MSGIKLELKLLIEAVAVWVIFIFLVLEPKLKRLSVSSVIPAPYVMSLDAPELDFLLVLNIPKEPVLTALPLITGKVPS